MILTDKCKIDFEKWYRFDSNIKFIPFSMEDKRHNSNIDFFDLPFSFQYVVYVDFFDSVGIVISVMAKLKVKEGFMYSIDHIIPNDYSVDFETRQEAREQAIKKANEIYNKK